MPATASRRSDRVCLTLLLEISGTDSEGKSFVVPAHTLLISRHGAVIVTDRMLTPNQNLHVKRTAKSEAQRQGMSRVIGEYGRQGDGLLYGIECQNENVDLWGVEFPPFEKATEAVARMLLECSYCHGREVIYLGELQLKGFEMNRGIARHCKTCGVPSIWVQAPHESLKTTPVGSRDRAKSAASTTADASAEQGPAMRLKTRLTACIRQQGSDDELAVCEAISANGVTFRSRRRYLESARVAIAVPYADGTANIFLAARVAQVETIPPAGLFRHIAEYVKVANGGSGSSS